MPPPNPGSILLEGGATTAMEPCGMITPFSLALGYRSLCSKAIGEAPATVSVNHDINLVGGEDEWGLVLL